MKTVSIFSLLAVFTSMAVALPADPTLFAEVNSWVNTTGITQSTTPNDFTKPGARGIEVIAPVVPADLQDFALNATIATEDSAGTLELLAPGDIFINCTVAANSAGEPNWIWINYNDTGAAFYAYGDAGAAFALIPPTTTTTQKRDDATLASIIYKDYGTILNPTAIINPYCPPSTATTHQRRRTNGGGQLYGRPRF